MQDIGEFIHGLGIGLLVTHCPGGRLAAWPLRVVPEGRAPWREGASLPLCARFSVQPDAELIRQLAGCPRTSATFQDGHRYCFLSGLARISDGPAFAVVEMQVLTAEYRELAGIGDLWGRSLDATRRA